MNHINTDYVAVENGLWRITTVLADKYGCDEAGRDMAPLAWYIGTGRATTAFLRALLTAKPFMVARRLHKGGSYAEVLAEVKKCIGYKEV